MHDCWGKFGGVFAEYAKLERNLLIAKGDYTEDTTYVLGEPQISSATSLVCAALSTDNLVLNAYRQSRFGVASGCHRICRSTRRTGLWWKGTACYPSQPAASCSTPTSSHTAYAQKRTRPHTHSHVIAVTRDAVNAMVRERALAKQRV